MRSRINYVFFVLAAFTSVIPPVAAEDARIMVQLSHRYPPKFLRYTRNGKRILSLSGDNSIKIFSLSGRLLQNLTGHQGSVIGAALSQDDRKIVSMDNAGEVILWSQDGKQLKKINTKIKYADAIAYLEKKDQVVFASGAGVINIWSMAGQKIKDFPGHAQQITAMEASANCECFLTGTERGEISVWNTDGKLKAKVSGGGAVSSLQITADGQKFLAGHSGVASNYVIFKTRAKKATLWDMSGNEQKTFTSEEPITMAAMTPDAGLVALGLLNDTILLFDTNAGTSKAHKLVPSHEPGVLALGLHPNAEQFASASWSENLAIRDQNGNRINGGEARRFGSFHTKNPLFHASEGGNLLIQAEKDGDSYFENVLSISINRGTPVRLKIPENILCLDARANPHQIAAGTLTGPVMVFDGVGQVKQKLPGHSSSVNYVGFMGKDGMLLASGGSYDGVVKLWDLRSGRLMKSFAGHVGPIDFVTIDSEKQILASYAAYVWYIWDLQSGNLTATYNGPGNPLSVKNPDKFVIVTADGRFDYAGDAHSILHWVVGDETIPLEQFKGKYHAPNLLAEILSGKTKVMAALAKPEIPVAKRLMGKVFQIKGNGDVVIYTKASGSLRAGKRLKILNGANYVDATISNTLHTNVTAKARGVVAVGNPVFE